MTPDHHMNYGRTNGLMARHPNQIPINHPNLHSSLIDNHYQPLSNFEDPQMGMYPLNQQKLIKQGMYNKTGLENMGGPRVGFGSELST
jgi:hypothetical protein